MPHNINFKTKCSFLNNFNIYINFGCLLLKFNNYFKFRQKTVDLMIISLFNLAAALTATRSQCDHDSSNYSISFGQTFPYQGRLNVPGSLRLQFRYTPQWTLAQTDPTGIKLKAINNVVSSFVSKLVQVQQEKIMTTSTTCGDISVPTADIGVQFDSDLIVYTRTYNLSAGTFYARAKSCVQRSTAPKRSIFGLAGWNVDLINTVAIGTNYGFQFNVRAMLHQVVHVLGFSWNLFSLFSKYPIYDYFSFSFFNGTNVIGQVSRYYNCSDKRGMPLENSTIFSSHWQKDSVMDQLMAAFTDPGEYLFLSNLTLNLLLDSGWYSSIDFSFSQSSFMRFGRNRGCSFLYGANCSNPNDYCHIVNKIVPKYYKSGYGYCQTSPYSQCYLSVGLYTFTCKYEAYNKPTNSYQESGADSNVFNSNITVNGSAPARDIQCYRNFCGSGVLKVLINSINYTCTDGATISIPGKGSLSCPASICFAKTTAGQTKCVQKGHVWHEQKQII